MFHNIFTITGNSVRELLIYNIEDLNLYSQNENLKS